MEVAESGWWLGVKQLLACLVMRADPLTSEAFGLSLAHALDQG